jgi:hypothetical protein
VDADCLSRMPVLPAPTNQDEEDTSIFLAQGKYEIGEEQEKDQLCSSIREKLSQGSPISEVRKFAQIGGILYYICHRTGKTRLLVVIPEHLVMELIEWCHDEPKAGHLGMHKTQARIQMNYYWPTLKKDVQEYVQSCHSCLVNKKSRQPAPGIWNRY